MQKKKLSDTATRQGCQGLLATPEDGGGEGQFSLEPSEGV